MAVFTDTLRRQKCESVGGVGVLLVFGRVVSFVCVCLCVFWECLFG